jgi:hypothetical protein
LNTPTYRTGLDWQPAARTALVSVLAFLPLYSFEFLPSLASATFVFWVSVLLIRSRKQLAIKELFLTLYALQYLLGPSLSFTILDEFNAIQLGGTYQMRIGMIEYFAYTYPAFWFLVWGIGGLKPSYSLSLWNPRLEQFTKGRKGLPWFLLILGFAFDFLTEFLPIELQFAGYLLSNFKFVSIPFFFNSQIKRKWLILALVYGALFVRSLGEGMFHDLVIWSIFLGLFFIQKYQISLRNTVALGLVFFFMLLLLQNIKSSFRELTWGEGRSASAGTILESNKLANESSGGLFTFDNLAAQGIRINQGWILGSSLANVPAQVEHSGGQLIRSYVESALLPRFLAPNKMNAGDKVVFNRYSGHDISIGTSMALGIFADGYIDFGIYGGWLMIALYGFFLRQVILFYQKRQIQYPILIYFLLIVFLYPVRPDCETQTVLGNIVKSTVLVFLVIRFFPGWFKAGSGA